MGVRQLLHAIKNRFDGKAFEVWEEADGTISAKMGDQDLVGAKRDPLTGGSTFSAGEYVGTSIAQVVTGTRTTDASTGAATLVGVATPGA